MMTKLPSKNKSDEHRPLVQSSSSHLTRPHGLRALLLQQQNGAPPPPPPLNPLYIQSSSSSSSSFFSEDKFLFTTAYHQPGARRSIIKTMVSYITCLVFVALGLNVLAGLNLTTIPTEESIDEESILRENQSSLHLHNGDPTQNDNHHDGDLISNNSLLPPSSSPSSSPSLRPTVQPSMSRQSTHPSKTSRPSTSLRSFLMPPTSHREGWEQLKNFSGAPPYQVLAPPQDMTRALNFSATWCDLKGVDWFPVRDQAWQQRSPAFIIPGAKYSGTQRLASYLLEHPTIVPAASTEPNFFFDGNFAKYITTSTEKTLVMQARLKMLKAHYPHSHVVEQFPAAVSMDATPGYLFHSTLSPRRILCVMPWVRLVVVLRHPVDRLYHHYENAVALNNLNWDFERWIERDFQLLAKLGLVDNTTWAPVSFTNLTLEDIAWYEYQKQSWEWGGAVGRSLYDIQLRQWFQALAVMGRKPAQEVYLVWADEFDQHPEQSYRKLLQFLHLPPQPWSERFVPLITPPAGTPMKGATRQRLEAFYAPYQKRLSLLLRRHGFPVPPSLQGVDPS